mmetsp:Transcript_36955/g.104292  ORF Transcript_36955/g.104292 Transcript_36955/m.104292 type:complete len:487 (-) Transcript_36955:124-1584(-)
METSMVVPSKPEPPSDDAITPEGHAETPENPIGEESHLPHSSWHSLSDGLGVRLLSRAVVTDSGCAAVRLVCRRWSVLGAAARSHLAPRMSSCREVPERWCEAFRGLRVLDLSGAPQHLPPPSSFVHLTTLRSLRMTLMQPSSAWLEESLVRLTTLTSLDLSYSSHFRDSDLDTLRPLTGLQTLCLSDTSISGSGMEAVSALTRLTSLDLSNCRALSAEGMQPLSTLVHLKLLNLTGCDVHDSGLQCLSSLGELTSLSFNGAQRLTSAGLSALANLNNLRTLEAAGCLSLANAGVEALTSLTQLHTLNLGRWRNTSLPARASYGIDHCYRLTDSSLAAIRHLTALRSLDLEGNKNFTDNGAEHIGALKNLTSLYLSGCSLITDHGVASMLPGLTTLRTLHLSGLSALSDEGLTALLPLQELNTLVLNGCCRLSGRAVLHLLQLPKLRVLHLHGCHNISYEAVEVLRSSRSLEVLWYAHPNEWIEYQ